MSWITDRINFCKATSHKAPPIVVDASCYSNERHHSDLVNERAGSVQERNEECGKLINELWLSRCEESLSTIEPQYLTPEQQGDKLLQATKLKALRRTWHHDAA
jgi:hypothetical protein